MNARDFLNAIKQELNLYTDEELSTYIGASKSSLDKWVQRNKVPDKWKFIIKEKLDKGSKSHNQIRIVGDNNQSNIVNGDIHINISQFDHKQDIEEIIRLLPYAPSKFLEQLKIKLKTFEELSDL
ncbi:helix-turn-helix domain-containing protein [Sulfurovum sp. zt1-1]|uniref:Helix-turn-helix domain-containing protein n=1 Tax=Sulfurovum zhangzhouensis TaxID=3019067 RepID=A0ABT7QYR2_9BACT|nr:helix-turn-helix domain-containing protein [Sulfurovum zhangzhouensis]MDM5271906.1 helix-turn-helix domain-containing protein [Sulfurovum zhangzhouensis]